jgi:hypothetical protein
MTRREKFVAAMRERRAQWEADFSASLAELASLLELAPPETTR